MRFFSLREMRNKKSARGDYPAGVRRRYMEWNAL